MARKSSNLGEICDPERSLKDFVEEVRVAGEPALQKLTKQIYSRGLGKLSEPSPRTDP